MSVVKIIDVFEVNYLAFLYFRWEQFVMNIKFQDMNYLLEGNELVFRSSTFLMNSFAHLLF